MTRLAPEHFPTVTLVHVPNPDHKVWYTCMHMLRWDQGMGRCPAMPSRNFCGILAEREGCEELW